MVDVRVRRDDRLFHAVEIRKQAVKDLHHLGRIAGEAAVDEEQRAVLFQNVRVAAAGRLDHVQRPAVRKRAAVGFSAEIIALKALEHLRKPADIGKSPVRGRAAVVEQLHNQVGVGDQRALRAFVEIQKCCELARKGEVKHRVVEHFLTFVVIQNAD